MSEVIRNVEKAKELIDKIPYLKDFAKEDKNTLSNISFFIEYKKDDVIIEQNSVNQQLYFLIRGEVNVVKDGKKLIDLRGGGRIFGEMSFVNHALASASIVANTDLVMLCFKIPGILSLDSEKHFQLKISLYKAIAEMLAQKLTNTTQIASVYKNQLYENDIQWEI